MGNRAVITVEENLKGTGVYLHWSGDRSSVEAFLSYCKMKGYRTPDYDNYGWAYLCCVIGCWFGDGRSLGVDDCEHLDCDNGDNGVYIIKDWMIVGRKYTEGDDDIDYDLKEYIKDIDGKMPEHMRLKETEWEKFEEVKKEVLEHRKYK